MSQVTKSTFRRVIIICIAGLLLGILRQFLFPGGVSLGHGEPVGVTAAGDSLSIEIELDTGYRLFQKELQFIDARAPAVYDSLHIPGAINIPAAVPFEHKMEMIRGLDKQQSYVLYCNNEVCPLSHELYEFLQYAGFGKLHIMYEGFDEWHEAGYPVKASAEKSYGS